MVLVKLTLSPSSTLSSFLGSRVAALLLPILLFVLLGGCSLLEGKDVHLPNLDMFHEFSENMAGEDPADAVDYHEQEPLPEPHTPYVGDAEEHQLDRLAAEDPVIFMYKRGNEHFNAGEYERAVASYDNVLVLEPEHPRAHFKKGASLHMLGRYEEALEEYDAHLALKPDDAHVYYDRGNTLSAMSRWNEAVDSYTRAIKLDSSYAEAYANRAYVYLKLGDAAAASQDADRARALNPAISIPESIH